MIRLILAIIWGVGWAAIVAIASLALHAPHVWPGAILCWSMTTLTFYSFTGRRR